jgi:hypothetical protein
VSVARTVRHRRLGFALDLPAGLDTAMDVSNVALVARAEEPDVPEGFRANLLVAAQPIAAGDSSDPQERTDAALEAHRRELRNLHLIDRSEARIAGLAGVRTLAHHNAGGRAIALEQWRFVREGLGWELSVSCPALDYPTSGARLALAAESIRFG